MDNVSYIEKIRLNIDIINMQIKYSDTDMVLRFEHSDSHMDIFELF
jgi:hypothetical protein